MPAERSGATASRAKATEKLPRRIPMEKVDEAMQAIAEASQTLIGEIQTKLDQDFMDTSSRRMLGQVFIGAPHRLATGEDGRVQEQDWTMADLMAASDRLMDEQEAGTRNHLSMDPHKAMSAQREFYRKKRKPIKQKADLNAAFTLALLDRVLATDVNISESFPVSVPEVYYEAQMVEVIRRTTLESGYILMEGIGEGSIRVVPSYDDDAFTQEVKTEQQIVEALKSRSRKEWDEIVEKQSTYIMEYLAILGKKAYHRTKSYLGFLDEIAPRLTKEGKKAFPVKQVKPEVARANDELSLWRGFTGVRDLERVIPWARRRLGKDADFKTLLQRLNGNKPFATERLPKQPAV